ncbi:uncharacterized protein LOC141649452 [Silene latifolia]|uniref:uncharacterized protein LOC141649452 n=1 Tax=Silene latifolia TaxID=37657 RepID=UPI003D784A84
MQSQRRESFSQRFNKGKGPSENDVLRTKSLHEINGIPGLPSEDDDALAENSKWITKRGKKAKHPVEEEEEVCLDSLIRFFTDDTKDEVSYWSHVVYCFVLGANPPWDVLHAGLVGKYVKSDQATSDKKRLGFARVMIELNVGQKCPKQVKFLDESGTIVSIKIKYEWRPDICLKCKGIGHTGDQCRKTDLAVKKKHITKQVWKPVASTATTTVEIVTKPIVETTTTNLTATVTEPVDETVTKPVQATDNLVVVDSPETTPVKQAIVSQREPGSVGVMKTAGKTYLQALDGSVTPKCGIETKINNNNVFNIANNILDGWSVTTNCQYHKGGRVWILWQRSLFDVQIFQYDAQFIHTKHKLEVINLNRTGTWALVGDFNTVLSPDERVGGNTKQDDMDDFIRCMASCGMTDIPSTGALFTWNNKQDLTTRIYSRLDRFLVNQAWLDIFPDMVAHFYPEGLFDHYPCIISNIKIGSYTGASYFPDALMLPVTNEEIKGIFFSTPIDKSPGPDGYTSGFFKYAWDIVGPDVCEAIKDFFSTGKPLNQINATNITLIPKYKRPTSVKHFRPIACCNMIYKVISKLFCNRLSVILPDIVHKNQGAFIKGKSILENILICQDIVKLYNRAAVSPRCLFKIDLQKAYDTVEWDFVKNLLLGLKFPDIFCQQVMTCISLDYFKGQSGLRQGDPISPLIFTLCMDYLTRIIKYATNKWPFQYHPLCKELKLSHLMFADDLLLFCKGNAQSVMILLRAFSTFSKASGCL